MGVFIDMNKRVLGFYRNRKYVATVQGLPDAVFPAISLSGPVSATLDFATDDYVFPSLPQASLDPDASLFTLECSTANEFSL